MRTSSGLQITPDRDLTELDPPDLLVVPGGQGTRRPPPALIEWLTRHGSAATRIASVCTGAFLLAEAGLLAGRRATTHWSHCDVLAERYPDIRVESDPIYILDGPIATSAAGCNNKAAGSSPSGQGGASCTKPSVRKRCSNCSSNILKRR